MLQLKLNKILILSVAIALFLVVGCDEDEYGYDDWDSNDDDLIERNEFDQVLTDNDYFSDWDSDGDGYLTEEEWAVGTDPWSEYDGNVEFTDWDANFDDQISEEEFNDGYFDTMDDDDSGTIDEDEWSIFY